MTNSSDHWLFLALNAGPDAPMPVVLFAIVAAKYLIALVPLHLGLVWIGGDRMMRFIALAALLALVIACAASQILGLVAYSPRPFILGIGRTLIDHRPSSSFPSNHGLVFFTYAAVLLLFAKSRLAWAFAGLGAVVAWSRIYLGVHYPTDMLGSAVFGFAAAVAAVWMMARSGITLLRAYEQGCAHVGRLAGRAFGRAPDRDHTAP